MLERTKNYLDEYVIMVILDLGMNLELLIAQSPLCTFLIVYYKWFMSNLCILLFRQYDLKMS